MAKRKTPKEIVARSRTGSWFDLLTKEDQVYVRCVVEEIIETPDAAVYSVAISVKQQLGLSVTSDNIAKKLKTMVEDRKKKNAETKSKGPRGRRPSK